MPPGIRIHIEVNENNIPCNIPESILLGTYLGVVARDLVLAPIAFPDWRNKGMEPFKKKMLAEVETQACNLLAEEGLTPEDGNIEANERVFTIVMGPEHSGQVRTQGFGVTPTRYFPHSKNEECGGSDSNFGQIASLREEFKSFRDNQIRDFGSFRDEMRQFMQ
ncbi:hypothetical protein IEQ34_007350 [Dendrobium chrysotoxum]|uniref:Uncharacterized protein n=1 Tax=Dendrobium chrysotoxum TaxID=161865 RepID=A0AAV7GSY4_DENCH|nr:hypothetical protein IEQ34_007350 [Dendrobium chrysotoxum]